MWLLQGDLDKSVLLIIRFFYKMNIYKYSL